MRIYVKYNTENSQGIRYSRKTSKVPYSTVQLHVAHLFP